ncbi:hypothetical protein L598_000300001340 [Mesorhizobium sp. J18]|uniref:PopZ family protein n=1 Tax=Mesorhizobium sp. J18 TaxID=935263 RepID=UPI00119B3330|nr:DUF2497 domain-containing protein [Mesorhizobium sp. J18]TWG95530.1 hypothetical protein L598_000300001340 [Mesorhizobium sp. J18]
MAQASSAQREPSMEEILASIRRIIEDSDPARNESSLTAFSSVEDDHDEEDVGTEIAEAESFRGKLTPYRDFVAQPDSMRPADMQASRHEDGEKAPSRPETGGKAPEIERPTEAPAADFEERAGEDKAAEVVAPEASRMVEPTPPESMQDAKADGAVATKPAIISEFTGRKVAAAFEELNEAVEATRRRNLDQLAEEMLRPMLREWLDSNLPALVEQLVREEIERIARGGVN